MAFSIRHARTCTHARSSHNVLTCENISTFCFHESWSTSSEESENDCPQPKAKAQGQRRPRAAAACSLDLGANGKLTYYSTTQRFTAVCCQHTPANACKKERKAYEGANPSQGRPLGFLYSPFQKHARFFHIPSAQGWSMIFQGLGLILQGVVFLAEAP